MFVEWRRVQAKYYEGETEQQAQGKVAGPFDWGSVETGTQRMKGEGG